jgi:lysophospholipase L1-like esterase
MKNIAGSLPARGMRLCLLLSFCVLCRFSPAADAPAEKSQSQPVRVACVGDSITYGYGLGDREHDSYPAQLGRRLGDGWDVRNFGVNAVTLLKKGDLPYWKQAAYQKVLEFKPDIAVILLGANDSKHPGDGSLDAGNAVNNWRHKADYVPDYEELIASFRQANPSVKIYVCLPTPCFPGRWGINDKTIHDEIIPMVRQVAKDSNATIIDLNGALSGKKELFPDTVHPNAAGAKLMAAAIYHALTGKNPPTDTP